MSASTSVGSRVLTPTGGFYPVKTPDGLVKLPSVTTILRTLTRTELLYWYGKLGTAEATHQFEEAGKVGETVHKLILRILNSETIAEPEWSSQDERVKNSVRAFVRWQKENSFVAIECEKTVYSLEHGYAGTLDSFGVCTRDGGTYLIMTDWKTGSVMLPDYLMQLAAYFAAFTERESNPGIKELVCVRLDKETGIPEEHRVSVIDAHYAFEAFLGCLKVWKFFKEVKNGNKLK